MCYFESQIFPVLMSICDKKFMPRKKIYIRKISINKLKRKNMALRKLSLFIK